MKADWAVNSHYICSWMVRRICKVVCIQVIIFLVRVANEKRSVQKSIWISHSDQFCSLNIVKERELIAFDSQSFIAKKFEKSFMSHRVSQSCAVAKTWKLLAPHWTTKASKVWFSYSHNCTMANGAVLHSVCQVWLSSGPQESFTDLHVLIRSATDDSQASR